MSTNGVWKALSSVKPGVLAAAGVLVLAVSVCELKPNPEALAAPASGGCDASLWKFVYDPNRLPSKSDCRTLGGRIRNFEAEPDGDYHIRFIADDHTLVNAKNQSEQGGALVVEPICQNTPSYEPAVGPCRNYNGPKFKMSKFCPGAPDNPPAPKGGKEGGGETFTCKNPPHIEITGFYTIDNDHGWMELHPINRIEAK